MHLLLLKYCKNRWGLVAPRPLASSGSAQTSKAPHLPLLICFGFPDFLSKSTGIPDYIKSHYTALSLVWEVLGIYLDFFIIINAIVEK